MEMSQFGSSIADLPKDVITHLTKHAIWTLVKQQNLQVSQFMYAMPQERFVFAQGVLHLIFETLNPYLLNEIEHDSFKSTMDEALKYYSKKFAIR